MIIKNVIDPALYLLIPKAASHYVNQNSRKREALYNRYKWLVIPSTTEYRLEHANCREMAEVFNTIKQTYSATDEIQQQISLLLELFLILKHEYYQQTDPSIENQTRIQQVNRFTSILKQLLHKTELTDAAEQFQHLIDRYQSIFHGTSPAFADDALISELVTKIPSETKRQHLLYRSNTHYNVEILNAQDEETIYSLREQFIADPKVPMSLTYRLLTSSNQTSEHDLSAMSKMAKQLTTKLLSYDAEEGEYLSFKHVVKHVIDGLHRGIQARLITLIGTDAAPKTEFTEATKAFELLDEAIWLCVQKNHQHFLHLTDLSHPFNDMINRAEDIILIFLDRHKNGVIKEAELFNNNLLRNMNTFLSHYSLALNHTTELENWPSIKDTNKHIQKNREFEKANKSDGRPSNVNKKNISEYYQYQIHNTRLHILAFMNKTHKTSQFIKGMLSNSEQYSKYTQSVMYRADDWLSRFTSDIIDALTDAQDQTKAALTTLVNACPVTAQLTIWKKILSRLTPDKEISLEKRQIFKDALVVFLSLTRLNFAYPGYKLFNENKGILTTTLQHHNTTDITNRILTAAQTLNIDLNSIFSKDTNIYGVAKLLQIYNHRSKPIEFNQLLLNNLSTKFKSKSTNSRLRTYTLNVKANKIEHALIEAFQLNIEKSSQIVETAYCRAECLIFNALNIGFKLTENEKTAIRNALSYNLYNEAIDSDCDNVSFLIVAYCHNIHLELNPNDAESPAQQRARIFDTMFLALSVSTDGHTNTDSLSPDFIESLKLYTCAYFSMFPGQTIYPNFISQEMTTKTLNQCELFIPHEITIINRVKGEQKYFDQLLSLKQANKMAYAQEDINLLLTILDDSQLITQELFVKVVLQLINTMQAQSSNTDETEMHYTKTLMPLLRLSGVALIQCSFGEMISHQRIITTQLQHALLDSINQPNSELTSEIFIEFGKCLSLAFKQIHKIDTEESREAYLTASYGIVEQCHYLLDRFKSAANDQKTDFRNRQLMLSFLPCLAGMLHGYAVANTQYIDFQCSILSEHLSAQDIASGDKSATVTEAVVVSAYKQLLEIIIMLEEKAVTINKSTSKTYSRSTELMQVIGETDPTFLLAKYNHVLTTEHGHTKFIDFFYTVVTTTRPTADLLDWLLSTSKPTAKSLATFEKFSHDILNGLIPFANNALPKKSADRYLSYLKNPHHEQQPIATFLCKLFAHIHTESDYSSLHNILQIHYGVEAASDRDLILTTHIALLDDKERKLQFYLSKMSNTTNDPTNDATIYTFDTFITSTNSDKVPSHWREQQNPTLATQTLTLTFTSDDFMAKLKTQARRLTDINEHSITGIFFTAEIYKGSVEFTPVRLIEEVMQLESETAGQFERIEKRIEDIKNGLLPNLQLFICLDNLDKSDYSFECKETKQNKVDRFNRRVNNFWNRIEQFIKNCHCDLRNYFELAHDYSTIRIKRMKLSSIEGTEQHDYEQLKRELVALHQANADLLVALQKWPNLIERYDNELNDMNHFLTGFNKEKLKVDVDINQSKEGRLYLKMTETLDANLTIPHTSLQETLNESILQAQIESANETERQNRQERRRLIQTTPEPKHNTSPTQPVLQTEQSKEPETKKHRANTPPIAPKASPTQKSPATPERNSPAKQTTFTKDELNDFKTHLQSIAKAHKFQFLNGLNDIEKCYASTCFNDNQPITSLFILLESLIRLLNLSTLPLNLLAGENQKFIYHFNLRYHFYLDIVSPNKDEVIATELKTLRALIMHAHYSVFTLPNFSTHAKIFALYSQLSDYMRALLDHLHKKQNAPAINATLEKSIRIQLGRSDSVRKDNESPTLEAKQNTLSLLKALYQCMKEEWSENTSFSDQAIASITLLSIVTRVFVTHPRKEQKGPKLSKQTRDYFMHQGHNVGIWRAYGANEAAYAASEVASLLEKHDSTNPALS